MSKMKKSWIALLLAALTTASLALSASAASLPQPQAAAEMRAQVEEYGSRPFREGLKPVLVDGVWMYMDQQSNIVDLNQGRFSYVYDFFDGLAAVIDKNTGKVGYIDKTGAIRIPCQFGYHDLMGTVYVGYFKDGKATVLKEYYPAQEDFSSGFPTYSSGTWQVAHIDKNGALTDSWKSVEGMSQGLYLIGDNGYMPDEPYEEAVEPLVFSVTGYAGKDAMYPGIGEENVFYNGAAYQVNVTNNTESPIQGRYGLISCIPNDQGEATAAQIHYFDIDLAPWETKEYPFASYYSGLASGSFQFVWIAVEDQDSFEQSVPYDLEQDAQRRLLKNPGSWLTDAIQSYTCRLWQTDGIFAQALMDNETVSSWAQEEFDSANILGLIPALTDEPAFTQAITREQFAQLIVNLTEKALGKELAQAPSDTFSDTSSPAILKAYEAGIITGMGDGTFEPKTTTNREQIATMIYRAVQYMEKETDKALTPAAGSVEAFQDKTLISDWAVEGVGKLAANAIMNGTSQSTASPKLSCTVEQSILLLYRLYQKV